MRLPSDWKRTATSSVLVIVFFGLMFGTKLTSLDNLTSPWQDEDYGDQETAWIEESSEDGGEFGEYSGDMADEYDSMPAYIDLQNSLSRLTQARTVLVHNASGTDEQAILKAGTEYREAITESTVALDRLRSRIPPDVFPEVALDLLSSFDLDEGMMFYQWETGSAIMGAE